MTTQEFGNKIKVKYPQYADMDDASLGQKMILRYPQYKDLVNDPIMAKPENTLLNNPLTRGIQKVFPGQKVGQAIGTLGGFATTAVKEKLGNAPAGATAAYDLSAPTPLQVGGDILSGAANVAGFKGLGTTGSFLQKAGKSAAIGAGITGGDAIAEGESAKDVAKSAAIGVTTGAATSAAFSGIEAALKGMRSIPARLINSATGQSKKELLAGKGLEKYVLENRKFGTADTLIKDSQHQMNRLNDYINKNLKSVPVTKGKITTKGLLERIVADVNEQGGQITAAEARQVIDKMAPQAKGLLSKPSMSLVTANKLRQSIDRTLGDKGFLTAELPYNKDILRSFTNMLREEVKTKAPEGTRAAFNSLSNEIRLSESLTNKIAQGSRNQIISFGDLVGGMLGGTVGGPVGILGGAAIKRAGESTPVKLGGAHLIDQANKALSPILEGLNPAIQTEILDAVSKVLSHVSRSASSNKSEQSSTQSPQI